MKGWGANIRGQDIKKRRELTAELADLESLEEDNSLTDEQLLRRGHIQNELLELMEKEEEYWHQKASEKWLLHGDNNTEYFHRIANGRKRKKTFSPYNMTRTLSKGLLVFLNMLQSFTNLYLAQFNRLT